MAPTSNDTSKMRRCPTSRSASSTPWCVYSERPVISMLTEGSESSSPSSSSRSSPPSRGSSGSTRADRSSGDHQGIDVRDHVVDPEDPRPALVGDHVGRRRRHGPIALGAAREAPQKALAGSSDDDRAPDRDDLVEPAEQLEVVVGRLPESDPRVEPDVLLFHSLAHRELAPILEEGLHLRDDVVVARVVLHPPSIVGERAHE